MEQDTSLIDIIKICLSLEKIASTLYDEFSNIAQVEENEELQKFWENMSYEEFAHLQYWSNLIDLAEQGKIPKVFENPNQVKEELQNIKKEVLILLEESYNQDNLNTNICFAIAYRMEMYMLHPAFETMFHNIKLTSQKVSPEDTYTEHLYGFINALDKFGKKTPELEQAEKTILQLWEKTQNLVKQKDNN